MAIDFKTLRIDFDFGVKLTDQDVKLPAFMRECLYTRDHGIGRDESDYVHSGGWLTFRYSSSNMPTFQRMFETLADCGAQLSDPPEFNFRKLFKPDRWNVTRYFEIRFENSAIMTL